VSGGNLKFTFPEGQPEKGKLVFDKDGGWTPEKNRTTSAIRYVRNGGEHSWKVGSLPQLPVGFADSRSPRLPDERRGTSSLTHAQKRQLSTSQESY
jgi:hypothetical protein